MINNRPSPRATNKQVKAKLAQTQMELNQKKQMQMNYNMANTSPNISFKQIAQMAKNSPMTPGFVEIFNPNSNKFEKVVAGVKIANSFLPPEKQINKDNLAKFGENAFKGIMLPKNSNEITVANGSYGLSKAPNPKPVNLNSGIVPTCYANDYMSPVEGSCSPMHITSSTLGLPFTTTNILGDYLIKTLAFDIQTRAQANVNFSLDVTTAFSATQIISSMNDTVRALQVYYYYSSILSYESDSRNKNSAMIDLRSKITSQMISDLVSLGRRLEDTPCPPRIVQWVRYMSMNYLSGNSQGSPLLKIAPTWDFSINTTIISSVLTTLNSATNSATFVLMRRAIPQWRIGKLFDVPVIPVYDTNFLTIFANLQAVTFNNAATAVGCPGTVLADDIIMYNSFNNRLDGAAYAMLSANVGSIATPGLCVANNTGVQSSRRSFYVVAGTTNWYPSGIYQFLSNSRPETFKLVNPTDTLPVKFHLSGAEMCQGVSVTTVLQSARNFVDFLFDINKIPTNGTLNSFNKRGNNRI